MAIAKDWLAGGTAAGISKTVVAPIGEHPSNMRSHARPWHTARQIWTINRAAATHSAYSVMSNEGEEKKSKASCGSTVAWRGEAGFSIPACTDQIAQKSGLENIALTLSSANILVWSSIEVLLISDRVHSVTCA